MKTVTKIDGPADVVFYGSSDDNFGYDAAGGQRDEQNNCANGTSMAYRVTDEEGRGVLVVGEYVDPGVWRVGVQYLDEDAAWPGFTIGTEPGPWPAGRVHPYSVGLRVTAKTALIVEEVSDAEED